MTKSPVLLYQRNYQDFKVPNEYKFHAKLYNFYLTTKWLSSNFPLYYQRIVLLVSWILMIGELV